MSKIVYPKNIGVPVPSANVANTDHLIVYYGVAPLNPSYSQPERIDLGDVANISKTIIANTSYWDVNIASELPTTLPSGKYDFSFTLMDTNGNEGNFSSPVSESIDFLVPPTLGTPVVIG